MKPIKVVAQCVSAEKKRDRASGTVVRTATFHWNGGEMTVELTEEQFTMLWESNPSRSFTLTIEGA